jgi:hypothetical protein
MSLTTKIETPSITYEQPIGLYIDGKWVKGKEGKTFETINPTNEKPIVAVHEAGPDGKCILPRHTSAADLFKMSILLLRPLARP